MPTTSIAGTSVKKTSTAMYTSNPAGIKRAMISAAMFPGTIQNKEWARNESEFNFKGDFEFRSLIAPLNGRSSLTHALRNAGARPHSAMPKIWNESQNSSAIYMPALLQKVASTIQFERKLPPMSSAILENDPSSQVVQCGELKTVAPKSGAK
ncbi:unnamed protein product [Phytophthora lilii]|uniref:Unnamed protein product n=1 Tax=Phytophthora lilii TaxID=2077276 RepID=A0A9W6WWW7_9STRA|nr:unnamed protein product [Phytophthora lilii]